ncbi:MAG: hypothetical protein JNM84_02365 [Planctomycetes bacterium]|nr:hypothetical protein [Planctomycetota bacterium]
MTNQRRSTSRLQLEEGAALSCQILEPRGHRTLAAGEILDLSERGVGIRLPSPDLSLEMEPGAMLVLRSTLPGTSWSMRRYARLANRRVAAGRTAILGLGWSDEAPQGPNYSNLQRWRYESFLRELRSGHRRSSKLRSVLDMLDHRIDEERHSLLEWMRGSVAVLDELCVRSEREKQNPLQRPLSWHEDVFDLVDPRFPQRPCQGRVLDRHRNGFDALLAVAKFPRALEGQELWALHRGLKPGQRRRLRMVAIQSHEVCHGLWRVRFEMLQRKEMPADLEIGAFRPAAAPRAG